MHAINDAWMNADFSRFSNGKFREDYGHYLGAAAYVVKFPSLISYVKDSFNVLWYASNIKEIDTDYFPGLISFERNLNTIIELGKVNGTQFVLLTQPNLYKDSISNEELKVLEMFNQEAIGNGEKWSYKTDADIKSKVIDMHNTCNAYEKWQNPTIKNCAQEHLANHNKLMLKITDQKKEELSQIKKELPTVINAGLEAYHKIRGIEKK